MKHMMLIGLLILAGCSAPPSNKAENNDDDDNGDDNDTIIIVNSDSNNSNAENVDNLRTCDECTDDEVCVDGFCQVEGCEPQCDGDVCGANGCGGICGTCEGRESCVSGACEMVPSDCSGFADDAASWSIPTLFADEQLTRLADVSSDCGGGNLSGQVAHQLLDLTGDGAPDLVLTDKCDGAGVGTTRWEVFENTGSGFAEEPTAWSLPTLFADEQLTRTSGVSNDCGDGNLSGLLVHETFDITGDGAPDLVLTDKCDGAGVGTTRWEVYENTGSGFADSPTSWSLPELFADEQLTRTANVSNDCGGNLSGLVAHQLLDITGNGAPDLVLTDKCDSAGVGTTRWEVYENTGSGFAETPTSWSLPALFADDQLTRTVGVSNDCGGGNLSGQVAHQVFDITGDGAPDLVLTDKCDSAGVGTTRWEVYENTGSGFAENATSWSLPTLFADEQLTRVADVSSDCGGGMVSGRLAHQLLDMDGDGMVDLLLTDKCDGAGVGTARWEYFRNQGNGFAAEPTSWSLPTFFADEQLTRTSDVSSECGSLSGRLAFSTLDIDADGLPDLVLTDKCDAAGVGTARWEVHAAECL